ncbi:hypothetical protein [Fimbriimonas ginsengisoli]|uniref:Uncharacterized protein n=1 Tax=Fimbriimonas ginsengisoli Gsoil 348 TaxID=661478 RepID=A0A068NIJ6_FIMGI|nr:hypothetical protein [Fimbriimonas ginsengisoli]AIE83428.1 hypothetical protein OP10G_0060 [Fimbriimonas ginsengisoli Gsoil 348]
MKRFFRAAFGLGILALYTLVVLSLSAMSSGKVLYRSPQPAGVNYGSYDPYELTIVEGPIKWNWVGWPRSSEIWVAPGGGHDYGYSAVFDAGGSVSVDKTTWSTEGIEVSFSSGHRLFIPKKAFIGGR